MNRHWERPSTDAAFLESLASFEQSLDAQRRSLIIARTFADAASARQPLPDAVVTAYLIQTEREEAQLTDLRAKVQEFKGWFRTH